MLGRSGRNRRPPLAVRLPAGPGLGRTAGSFRWQSMAGDRSATAWADNHPRAASPFWRASVGPPFTGASGPGFRPRPVGSTVEAMPGRFRRRTTTRHQVRRIGCCCQRRSCPPPPATVPGQAREMPRDRPAFHLRAGRTLGRAQALPSCLRFLWFQSRGKRSCYGSRISLYDPCKLG